MGNGRWPVRVVRQTRRTILEDAPVFVRIMRPGRDTQPKQVCEFTTRIAKENANTGDKDRRRAIGDASATLFVLLAPPNSDVQRNDEAWVTSARYRVLSVEPYESGQQVLAQLIT